MKKCIGFSAILLVMLARTIDLSAQKTIVVRRNETDEVLTNPGIGFTTFQRFNGDTLNAGVNWTEGNPIEYQKDNGYSHNRDYPMSSIAYFRIYWKFIEPEQGKYNWSLIKASLFLATIIAALIGVNVFNAPRQASTVVNSAHAESDYKMALEIWAKMKMPDPR